MNQTVPTVMSATGIAIKGMKRAVTGGGADNRTVEEYEDQPIDHEIEDRSKNANPGKNFGGKDELLNVDLVLPKERGRLVDAL